MRQRRRTAWGGLPPNGGEAFSFRPWNSGCETQSPRLIEAMVKRGTSTRDDGASADLAGILLSPDGNRVTLHEVLPALSG